VAKHPQTLPPQTKEKEERIKTHLTAVLSFLAIPEAVDVDVDVDAGAPWLCEECIVRHVYGYM
jgi:hypothetical protein